MSNPDQIGDLPTIFRVVSLEHAAGYKRAVDILGPAVSMVSFALRTDEQLRELARAQAAYVTRGPHPNPQSIQAHVTHIAEKMLSIGDDPIAVIIHGPDQAVVEALPFEVEELSSRPHEDSRS